MRLRQIEIFYHVYRAGSISDAARSLNVSQPSVSKVLRHAEDQLGFDLFVRAKGRLHPTPQADELFSQIKEIYGKVSSLNRTANNIRGRRGGHLRIGVLPSLGLTVAPRVIAQLRQQDDNSSYDLTTLHSDQIASSLLEKRCDICVGFEASPDSRFTVRKLGNARLLLVSSKRLETESGAVKISQLDNATFVGIHDSGPLASLLSNVLEQESIQPNEVVTTHTYSAALALVRLGVGLAVIDEFTANSYLGADLFCYPVENLSSFSIFSTILGDATEAEMLRNCWEEFEKQVSGNNSDSAR